MNNYTVSYVDNINKSIVTTHKQALTADMLPILLKQECKDFGFIVKIIRWPKELSNDKL